MLLMQKLIIASAILVSAVTSVFAEHNEATSVCFLDESSGWVGVIDGRVFVTNDGGKTLKTSREL